MSSELQRWMAPADGDDVTIEDVRAAAQRLAGAAHRTPVVTSRTLDDLVGAEVLLKGEHLQRVGAFKIRGAYNAIAQLDDERRARGVLTFSSGNHAQAIALAGRLLDTAATIVMPNDAPAVKLAATRGYGGEVILYERAELTREALAVQLASERGQTIIPPYDHPHIVAGQGTVALELFDQVGALDLLVVPCGGGGLLSGCAVVAKALWPECRVIGVEPAAADDATRSFHTGTLQTVRDPATVADGARTPSLGRVTFALVRRHVDAMVTVEEPAIVRAMFLLWERAKAFVEPTAALGVAALLAAGSNGALNEAMAEELERGRERRASVTKGSAHTATRPRVGVVLTGGNVDLDRIDSYRRLAGTA